MQLIYLELSCVHRWMISTLLSSFMLGYHTKSMEDALGYHSTRICALGYAHDLSRLTLSMFIHLIIPTFTHGQFDIHPGAGFNGTRRRKPIWIGRSGDWFESVLHPLMGRHNMNTEGT